MELLKTIRNEYQKALLQDVKSIRAIKGLDDDKLKNWWYREKMTDKTFKRLTEKTITLKELKQAMIKKATKQNKKLMDEKIQRVEIAKSNEPVKWGKIDIYTNYSRYWGYSPKGEYKNGFFYKAFGAVGGCGYDKNSTLSADMLNSDNNFKSYFYNFIEKKHINKKNILKKLGYGVTMSRGIPYFEGGVGLECHIKILKNLGFNVTVNYNKVSTTIIFEAKKQIKH